MITEYLMISVILQRSRSELIIFFTLSSVLNQSLYFEWQRGRWGGVVRLRKTELSSRIFKSHIVGTISSAVDTTLGYLSAESFGLESDIILSCGPFGLSGKETPSRINENAARHSEIPLEWSHHKTTSKDSRVKTTLYSIINMHSTKGKYCSVAFIWMVTP